VIGASGDLGGSIHLSVMLKHGFLGKLYTVNQRGGEVLGLKAYTSLREIPGPVDFAFVQVPARATIQVVRDCAAKGVKLAAIFSAGFGESENEWGSGLEQELVSVARQGGVRLLGPNCMGLYCPAVSLTFGPDFPVESGVVGALCQSGGNAHQVVYSGAQRGMRFSKVISYGNAIDLNEADLMEYFARDPETSVVIAYLEGVKEGRRFYQALNAAAQAKPVIVFKGGQTAAGGVSALSHTGSLAGSNELWDRLVRQAGAIQACNIDECVDVALACLLMKPPAGRRLAVFGNGGGASVQAADDCYRAGLVLPTIPDDIRSGLKKFIPVAGNILKNPLDIGGIFASPCEIGHTIEAVGEWTGVDLLIFSTGIGLAGDYVVKLNFMQPAVEAFIKTAKEIGKPAAVVVHAVYSLRAYQGFFQARQMCAEAGIPFYSSVQQAANSIDKLIRYHERLRA
jgi:acyl-CoA synthetase (NDP forming)